MGRTENSCAWLVAAENAWIPGGKVGGVGDVVRDLPPALARSGWNVRVIVPAYGAFHRVPGATMLERIEARFGGETVEATAWRLPGAPEGVEQVVIDHSLLCPGQPGEVYHADPGDRPFETDATKFALFCAVVAAWVGQAGAPPDVVHLHDWHTGLVPFLRERSDPASVLAATRMVFTVHNLAYQGVRPMAGHHSSLGAWFPEHLDAAAPAGDPANPALVNFMAAALRLADGVATVSPTYAREIVLPNDPSRGFHGGEGLEGLLRDIADQGRLSGILNGCEYPAETPPSPSWADVVDSILDDPGLIDRQPVLRERLQALRDDRPRHVLLNIGRIVHQKVALLLEPVADHPTALDALLATLGDDGIFVLLGSGDPTLEARLRAVAERRPRFLFLRGYAEQLSNCLYRSTDLFVMPSSFEPCGISQMLALRAGQPCVVHGVGGLADTVEDGETGFVFHGDTPARQAQGLVAAVQRALHLADTQPGAWSALREAAAAQRFSWDLAARRTIERLYRS